MQDRKGWVCAKTLARKTWRDGGSTAAEVGCERKVACGPRRIANHLSPPTAAKCTDRSAEPPGSYSARTIFRRH